MPKIGLNVQIAALQPGDLATIAASCSAVLWIYQRAEEAATRAALAQLPALAHYARPYPMPWLGADLSGFAGVVLANEPNNPADPCYAGPADLDRANAFQGFARVLQDIKARYPALPVISPAVSPGIPGWEEYLRSMADLVTPCDLVGVHRYAGVDTVPAHRAAFPGKPLAITEQGWPNGDPLWATDSGDPLFLFAARWEGHAGQGWDVLTQPSVLARMRALKEGPTVPNVPELDQGWTKACWAYATAECFDAAGHYVSPFDIYAQVKGQVFNPPGLPATFDELRAGINAAAAMTRARLKWFGPLGVANDPGTVAQLVRDGWFVIAGVAEGDLQPGQNFGHYIVITNVSDPNAAAIVDSYRAEDGGSDRYPWSQLVQAMGDNWDQNVDALAFQIVA